MMRFLIVVLVFFVGLANPASAEEAHDKFFNNLLSTCGHSYLGQVVEGNENDDTWRQSKIIIHTPACTSRATQEIRIPLHVGENKSRTWIISKTQSGLRLKHDHRHDDGTPDDVTMYGGDTATNGTANTQAFPVDEFSKALFVEFGLDVSVTNTWTISIEPDDMLSYRLSRPGRVFQVNFDLSKPVN